MMKLFLAATLLAFAAPDSVRADCTCANAMSSGDDCSAKNPDSAPLTNVAVLFASQDGAYCICNSGNQLCDQAGPVAPPSFTRGAGSNGVGGNPNPSPAAAPPPPTPPPPVFDEQIAQTNEPVEQAILKTAKAADGRQSAALLSARETSALGSNQAATVAAVYCAQSMNALAAHQSEYAADYLASCRKNFSAADALRGPAGLTGFTANEGTLNSEAGKLALERFEQNFHTPGPAYFHQVMNGGGASSLLERLSSLTEEKIPATQLEAAFEASGNKEGASSLQYLVNSGGPKVRAPRAPVESLRRNLAEKLQRAVEERALASEIPPAEKEAPEHLVADSASFFPAPIDEESALTIFEVVHEKYRSITHRLHR